MIYAIIGEDCQQSLPLRRKARPAHLARLKQLAAEDRLILAGPFPAVDNPDPGEAGFSGSLIVALFDSLASAEAWIHEDPYYLEGVFVKVTVKPFNKVLP
ncbi:MAG: YciI family protein [Magnetococcales bacterium]|nr:YciI family protein [Magnetococcales bacterium]